jgi:CHAD domain-containing protein
MEAFAIAKVRELLSITVAAIGTAAATLEPEPVHKMRVSIRRLQQAFRLFRQFLRRSGVEVVRAELKDVMEAAGELRNYDIALGLLRRAREDAPEIRARHLAARQVLRELLGRVGSPDLESRWSAELGIASNEALEA